MPSSVRARASGTRHRCASAPGSAPDCIIGKNVYVDVDVVIGDRCKVQNNVSLFHGVTVEDGVFIGPHVCFTNDRLPRAINADGSPKTDDDWEVSPILVRRGAALGANSTILPGITIGALGDGRRRQRGDPRRGRSRARGRQPGATARQRLCLRAGRCATSTTELPSAAPAIGAARPFRRRTAREES